MDLQLLLARSLWSEERITNEKVRVSELLKGNGQRFEYYLRIVAAVAFQCYLT